MEAIKMTLSEKIEQELERDLQKAMEDKDFNLLVKRLKISKDLAKKNNTSLQDTCSELKNCSNCQGLFMCKIEFQGMCYILVLIMIVLNLFILLASGKKCKIKH